MSSAPSRVVVVGASAGGVEALSNLVASLPDDFPWPVCIVLHMSPFGTSVLPSILDRAGVLPAQAVGAHDVLEPGRIYVAPPDRHAIVTNGEVRLDHGPRVNGHRPAVDVLFRSAAAAHGPRVVGVVLSGSLDDGTAGLAAIKEAGGLTVVQDPEEAIYTGMPASAIAHVDVDHVLTIEGIGDLLARLGDLDGLEEKERAMANSTNPGPEPPAEEEVEAWRDGRPAAASGFTCPSCGGALWEAEEGGVLQFRCHIGHVYSQESMLANQANEAEDALWAAHSLLQARAALLRRLAARMEERDAAKTADRYEQQAEDLEKQAQTIRTVARSFEVAEPLSEPAA